MRDWPKVHEQDQADVRRMAHANQSYLHHSVEDKRSCDDPMKCKLCYNAARLAVQHYRRILEKRIVNHIMSEYDVQCEMTHPGGD